VTAQPETWHLEEGHLAIDFINTAYLRPDASDPYGYQIVDESLHSFADLANWAQESGVLGDPLLKALRSAPESAADSLATLITLREALRRVLRDHLGTGPNAPEMLAAVNQQLLPSLRGTVLLATDRGFVPDRIPAVNTSLDEAIAQLTWAIALSVEGLLTDAAELALIKECPGDDCGYLFRDSSRGRRRWCSMATCGNRAKVHRFRERHTHETSGISRQSPVQS
jgi:predicted RNA-binding Zn ribbon-like protein